jgi:hypothetical protein
MDRSGRRLRKKKTDGIGVSLVLRLAAGRAQWIEEELHLVVDPGCMRTVGRGSRR